MCFDLHARPPLPPISGGAGIAGRQALVLEASDGNRFNAFSARTTEPDAPGIVILPDVRGLHPFYAELAVRFAEARIHATAFDYYGRTAGIGERGEGFDHQPHRARAKPDAVSLDAGATIDFVRSAEGGGAERVLTVGFCFGGRHSFLQATRGHGLAGVIGFYGPPQETESGDANAPTALASHFACPVLGLFGGADRGIPIAEVERFRRALDDAGVANEIAIYEGAPHSFFDRSFEEHRDACDDAWRRMLDFVGRAAADAGG
jgi:carboxymethylenebutenolidase